VQYIDAVYNSRLIEVLKDEEDIVRQKMQLYEIDNHNPIVERKRPKKYVQNDDAILHLVEDFNNIVIDEDSMMHHLRALQYRIQSFDFVD
jgi:hypothetical protein